MFKSQHPLMVPLASGNFGSPITAALIRAGFDITIITRVQSTTTHPSGIRVIRTNYTVKDLTKALAGQDAAVCVVGPGGIEYQVAMIDAAEAAGVQRFLVDDYGWGPYVRGLPEFGAVHAQRRAGWDHAKARADVNPRFSYTGITTGNPIDWVRFWTYERKDLSNAHSLQAMERFPLMGFDIAHCSAIIYDSGTEKFTGTTLEGIGQAVLGVLQHLDETENKFMKVQSIQTCQNELLEAFQTATGRQWDIHRSTTKALMESGRSKLQAGTGGWVLDLVVAQLFDEGQARCVVAPSRAESDAELLGLSEETPQEVVAKVLKSRR